MKPIEIAAETYWVGVNDFETDLFEAIWPLPNGISYNSYLIVDEKVALIDTVKKTFTAEYLDRLKTLLNGRAIDYLIINHIEPDHSGSIDVLFRMFPNIQIIGNAKTQELLNAYYHIGNNFKLVQDGEALSLGSHNLKFSMTPMVHWPETMMTYDEKTKTLFSGDAFGAFGALSSGLFDDEVDLASYADETRRYFSNIIAKYSSMAQKAIAKLSGIEIKMIASTHGPIYRKNPGYIIDFYRKLSAQETEKGVLIAYASMYENTKQMAEAIATGLEEKRVPHKIINVSHMHLSFLFNEAWKYKGIILGSPTYNTKLFPLMQSLVEMIQNSNLQNRFVGFFGSYGWSGGAMTQFKTLITEKGNLKLVEPIVEVKGGPIEKDLDQCRQLGLNMADAVLK